MALGFWKQRALSSDFFENASENFESSKGNSSHDGDERPSSGDSGISECPLLGKCLPSVQMKSEDESRPPIKMEPEEAVNLTSEAHGDLLTEFPSVKSVKGQNKENAKPQQKHATGQKKSSTRKTTAKDPSRNHEPQKRAIKQEKPSEVELIANSDGVECLRTRRIEANARERSRVHTIGAAFEALRQTVPSNCDQQKLSKLAILRIATAYIRALSSLLEENSKDFALGVEQCTQALLLDGVRSKYPKSVS